MEHFTIELCTVNSCGVLHRIAGVYAKCKYNIDSMTVEPAAGNELSFMRITSKGTQDECRHLLRLLARLYDVKSVVLSEKNDQNN